ncbi:NAD(P)H-hydrate dehydratase [Sessilibacter sp. MAH4]
MSDVATIAISNRLYRAEQVRELDRRAIHDGQIPGRVLMKRAGRACFEMIKRRYPQAQSITVFCGGGNNGGDGYVIAALAAQEKMTVRLIAVTDPAKLQGDAALAYQYALQESVVVEAFGEHQDITGDVLVDALLGTGLRGVVNDQFAAAISLINATSQPVVAVDIPSGLCADTGAVLGCAVKAQATATFIGQKLGLYTGFGPAHTGACEFFSLNVPEEYYSDLTPVALCLKIEDLVSQVPDRAVDSYKTQHGKTLIVGGSEGFGGAALLASEACARLGSGLTVLATAPAHVVAALVKSPEVMVRGVSDTHELKPFLKSATTVAIGPGLGQEAWGQQFLQQVLGASIPAVFDADALNLLAKKSFVKLYREKRLNQSTNILTPHPGEAARLLDKTIAEVQSDRVAAACALAEKYSAWVVLKGAGTVIASPEQEVFLCPYGNPGMASGGMGDVLTGVLAALIAQGFETGLAVKLAVCLHSKAADQLAQQYGARGLLAGDVIATARALFNGVADEYRV